MKIDYSKLFTKRKDGVYQKFVNGKYLYSKDPEVLYKKWKALDEPTVKTFEQVGKEWVNAHMDEIGVRTWHNYQPHYIDIINRYKDSPIENISAQDVNTDLLRAKSLGYSMTIVKTRKTIWRQILDYAVVKDYVKYNPAVSVKLPKGLPKGKRPAPTEAEMRIVFANINEPFGMFAYLLLCTGMRKAEALALTKSGIDLDKREIYVTKSLEYKDGSTPYVKAPKTETSVRTIPIVSVLAEPLAEYMANISGEILFPAEKSNRNPGGGYMTAKSYDTAWTKYCSKAGLNITAHQLRHGAATIMFESGVDVYTAQRILGHANISTTMGIYTELREKQKTKSVDRLDEELKKYKNA